MRARGLKLILQYDFLRPYHVAPHAGAWVETSLAKPRAALCEVAPHAGAWVETGVLQEESKELPSRAPCGRVG